MLRSIHAVRRHAEGNGDAATKKTGAPRLATAGHGRLRDKVALITGAGCNFGETIVRRYLEEGATVVMVGRNRSKLEATLQRVQNAIGRRTGEPFILPFDAADPGQARLGIEQVIAKYGRLDVLVNNAGSTGPKQPLGNVPLTREEVDALRAQGGERHRDRARRSRQPVRPDVEHGPRGGAASAQPMPRRTGMARMHASTGPSTAATRRPRVTTRYAGCARRRR